MTYGSWGHTAAADFFVLNSWLWSRILVDIVSTETAVVAASELVKPCSNYIYSYQRGLSSSLNPFWIPFVLWFFTGNYRIQIFVKWKKCCSRVATQTFPLSEILEMLLNLVLWDNICIWSFCTLLATFLLWTLIAYYSCLLLFTINYFAKGSSLLLPIRRDLARKCKNWQNHLYSCLCGLPQKLQAPTWIEKKSNINFWGWPS